eukprot:Em0004g1639a
MGRRKFRLGIHRKNEERAKHSFIVSIQRTDVVVHVSTLAVTTSELETPVDPSPLTCSVPLIVISEGVVQTLDALATRLRLLNPFPSWTVADQGVLIISKMHFVVTQSPKVFSYCVSINQELQWSLSIQNKVISLDACTLLSCFSGVVNSVSKLRSILEVLDTTTVCMGNPDQDLVHQWHRNASSLHSFSGNKVGCLDDSIAFTSPTIRHKQCQILLPTDHQRSRCTTCSTYRCTLMAQNSVQNGLHYAKHMSHINYRYQPVSCLATRLIQLRKQLKRQSAHLQRLKIKISQQCETLGVAVDDSLHSDLRATSALPDCTDIMQQYPKDSFPRIFWQQQMEAASRKNARTMRWHPLMIHWCLSLRHRSSGAYEAIRDSGCLKLPLQRTLRDYTHYVEAKCGFSVEIDSMLKSASKVDTCPEREKCTILLIDEMHIREDLVYDKHSGELIGFTNMANISNSLAQLERSMSESNEYGPSLAKSMSVFMTVRNCFMSNKRSLWCKGKNIWWNHLKKFYDEDSNAGMGLRMVPKLKYEHLHINSFSAMRVDLAAQVLSESVSQALHLTGGDEVSETAHFIGMMDRFFDALNVHNFSHGSKALKPFQLPYTSATDFRLKWFKDTFLCYLKEWKVSVQDRVGISKSERNRMLLSDATQLGLEMTSTTLSGVPDPTTTLSGVPGPTTTQSGGSGSTLSGGSGPIMSFSGPTVVDKDEYISEWQKFFGSIPDTCASKYWPMVYHRRCCTRLDIRLESINMAGQSGDATVTSNAAGLPLSHPAMSTSAGLEWL